MTRKLTVKLHNDGDLEDPCKMDCQWQLYSFCTRHTNFRDPKELGLGTPLGDDGLPPVNSKRLQKKLASGLAFLVSYYEHGQSTWFLYGSQPAGVEFQWDGVRIAGLLIWEHPAREIGGKTPEARAEDAARFLETYTSWANGEGFGYSIEDEHGEEIDSCYGFYGNDAEYMFSQIREAILCESPRGAECEVAGEAAWLANYHSLKTPQEKQDEKAEAEAEAEAEESEAADDAVAR